jgi:hypothetical protein
LPVREAPDSVNRHRLRVNRASIVWLAVRRQGSIVPPSPADLHLDCARSPGRGRYGFTRKKAAVWEAPKRA